MARHAVENGVAGEVTEVCVAFPALSAVEGGYEVFVITDASGTFNEVTRHTAWLRMQAGKLRIYRVLTSSRHSPPSLIRP
jgi:nicotinamidase-related amidase